MSNNDNSIKMEATVKTNCSNKSNANKDPGIYTCPTCNALFTCLKFYQQHVTQHAESNGIKLFCCNKCRYSTEVVFQFNWHQMSHKGAPVHSCSVCEDKSSDNHNSNNQLNGDDSLVTGKSTRKSQQNGNSNKKVKYSNSKGGSAKEDDEDDEEDEDDEDSDADSNVEESDENDSEDGEEDDEDDSESDEEDEEEEIKEGEEKKLSLNANSQKPNSEKVSSANQDEEISDDEDDLDDEEEEIESEEDNGEINELSDDLLNSQRTNKDEGGGTGADMQNSNANLNNNSTIDTLIEQGAPFLKSSINPDLPTDILNDTGIICSKGRGKGNRKSRTQKQMGGQVEDEFSHLRRKFHCSHCGKSFKTKSHLQRHILTHTGEKPYHCNRCGAKFNQSSSLRNHIIALHTKEYPHFCNHCNKGFLMPALLVKHLHTSHKDLPHQEVIF